MQPPTSTVYDEQVYQLSTSPVPVPMSKVLGRSSVRKVWATAVQRLCERTSRPLSLEEGSLRKLSVVQWRDMLSGSLQSTDCMNVTCSCGVELGADVAMRRINANPADGLQDHKRVKATLWELICNGQGIDLQIWVSADSRG